MTIKEIKTAVDNGKNVYWSNKGYKVTKSKNNEYLIVFTQNNNAIGLTNVAGDKLNGKEEDFFTD